MEYKKDDIVYIIENNKIIKPARVVSRQGEFYTIQLVGSCGAIRLKKHRLYSSEEEAMAVLNGREIDIAGIKQNDDGNSKDVGFVDVYEGKRFRKNPYR